MTEFHITRARLAPSTGSLGALLADAGADDGAHRLLWTLFPGEDSARDFIYRAADARTFLIVSQRPAVDAHKLWRLDSKPYLPEPSAGERYSFILRANPSIDLKRAGQRSMRVDAVMHAKTQARAAGRAWNADMERTAALDWLFDREAWLGVRFDRECCDASGYAQAAITSKKSRKGGRPICFSAIDYDGVLDVVDGARFADRLKTGIGRARAYGCGLMLIRRA